MTISSPTDLLAVVPAAAGRLRRDAHRRRRGPRALGPRRPRARRTSASPSCSTGGPRRRACSTTTASPTTSTATPIAATAPRRPQRLGPRSGPGAARQRRVGRHRARRDPARRAAQPRPRPISTARATCSAAACCPPSSSSATPASCASATRSGVPGASSCSPPPSTSPATRDGPLHGAWPTTPRRRRARATRSRTASSISRVFPSLYRDSQVHRLAPFFRTLRAALQEVAPPDADDPRIVVLTPGPWSETAFEHAFLPSHLGYPLVEGVRPHRARRPGVAALARPARTRSTSSCAASTPGSATRSSCARLPARRARPGRGGPRRRRCRSSTRSAAACSRTRRCCPSCPGWPSTCSASSCCLPSVPTWWCGDDDGRRHVLGAPRPAGDQADLPRGSGRRPCSRGSSAATSCDDLRRRIEAHPAGWVGQEADRARRRRRRSRRTGSRPGAPCCARSPWRATTPTRPCPAA